MKTYTIELRNATNGKVVGTKGPYATQSSALSEARKIARQFPHKTTVVVERTSTRQNRAPRTGKVDIEYRGHRIRGTARSVTVEPYGKRFTGPYAVERARSWVDGHVEATRANPVRGSSPSARWPYYEIQAILLDKRAFTRGSAKEWAKKHGFKHGTVKAPGRSRYWHIPQRDASDFAELRTDTWGDYVRVRMGPLKTGRKKTRYKALRSPNG